MNNNLVHDALLTAVATTIQRFELLKPGEKVLVALSGGLDSIVLLHVLRALGYEVEAAHFDHQTRDGQSTQDAQWVKETCAAQDIQCHLGTGRVALEAKDAGTSFEAYARGRRYAFLLNAATASGVSVVATGHQLNDQAETILMGLLGLASDIGPGGMAPITVRNGIRIVRPLIACCRKNIHDWAIYHGIHWREDISNTDRQFARNRVRMDVIPVLEATQPDYLNRLSDFADAQRSNVHFIETQSAALLDMIIKRHEREEQVLCLDDALFRAAPEAVRRYALKLLARRCGIALSFELCMRVEAFLRTAPAGKLQDFGKGFRFFKAKDQVHLLPPSFSEAPHDLKIASVPLSGTLTTYGYRIETRYIDKKTVRISELPSMATPLRQYFDLGALKQPLQIRLFRIGDRITPFGMLHSRKVADLIRESNIPAWRRHTVPIMVSADKVLWVIGCRRSAHAPVRASSENIIEVTCRPVASDRA